MPIPKRKPNEDKTDFLLRCMSNPKMNQEYPDNSQRYTVCQQSSKGGLIQEVSDAYYDSTFGSEELIFDESEMYIPAEAEYVDFGEESEIYNQAADKPKVKLNKPFRTPKGPKKFSVYVKNDKGNIVKVNFGDPNMDIKRDDPERRKSFRARHQCDTNPGPKWKARYWSCKFWESKKSVTDLT